MRTPAQVYRDMRQGQADKANAAMDDPQYWPPAVHQFWQPASPDAHRSPLDLVPDEDGPDPADIRRGPHGEEIRCVSPFDGPYKAGLTDDPLVGWEHFAGPGAHAEPEGEMGGRIPGFSNRRHPYEFTEAIEAMRDREPSPEGRIPGMGPMSLEAERALEAAQGPAEPEAGQ